MGRPTKPTRYRAPMSENVFATLLFLGIGVIALGLWVVSSKFEADAYNRLTGGNVTTWDAMFVKLRVEGTSDGK